MGLGKLSQFSEPESGLICLGIVSALPIEAQAFSNSISPLSQYQLGDGVTLQLAGVGHERARAAARKLVATGTTALMSWGLAGALDPTLKAGTLVLPDRIIGADGTGYAADPDWHQRLLNCLYPTIPCVVGTLADSPEILKTVTQKQMLRRKRDAIAVDMETAAVAAVAKKASIPFIAIRFIIDAADVMIPESARCAIDNTGQLQPLTLLQQLFRRPVELPGLIRLALASFRARRQQSQVIELVAPHFLTAIGQQV